MKIAIIGSPKMGKTTLAKKLAKERNLPIVHTDDYIDATTFTKVPEYVRERVLKDRSRVIVEGVQTIRILTKTDWKPDLIYIMDTTGRIEHKYKGLHTMHRSRIPKYLAENPDIKVIRKWKDWT